jgi:hypothetical protein
MTDPTRPVLFDMLDASTDGNERVVATGYSRGPWHPDHCHGGPSSALLARACENIAVGGEVDWQIARLTVELTRPVPVGTPIEIETEIERPGRKVSLVAARLRVGDTVVAHARALRIRRADMELPDHPVRPAELTGPAGAGELIVSTWPTDDASSLAFHASSCEHRFVDGGWDEDGPCKVWIRLLVDLVAGESPSGVQRAAAAADFGNGVSSSLDSEVLTFINPDLTIHLARPPEGEWIGLSSHSVYGVAGYSTGSGYAESALHDEVGVVGRSVQSLILQET